MADVIAIVADGITTCKMADVIAIVANGMPHCEMAVVIAIVADGIATCKMADVIANCGRWNNHTERWLMLLPLWQMEKPHRLEC